MSRTSKLRRTRRSCFYFTARRKVLAALGCAACIAYGYDTDPRRFGCGERDACVCRCRCPDSACNMKVPSEADGGWCCVRILSSGEIGRPVRSARLTTEISQGIVHTDGSPPCLILRVGGGKSTLPTSSSLNLNTALPYRIKY